MNTTLCLIKYQSNDTIYVYIEDAKLRNFAALFYSMTMLFCSIPLIPNLLDIVRPLNESRPRTFAIVTELELDQEKYFVPIFCYHIILIGSGTMIIVSVDTMYVAFTAHACGLFMIIKYVHARADNQMSRMIL